MFNTAQLIVTFPDGIALMIETIKSMACQVNLGDFKTKR